MRGIEQQPESQTVPERNSPKPKNKVFWLAAMYIACESWTKEEEQILYTNGHLNPEAITSLVNRTSWIVPLDEIAQKLNLKPREEEVMALRFGEKLGETKHPLRTVGSRLGVSGERIRQIQRLVERKLRTVLRLRPVSTLGGQKKISDIFAENLGVILEEASFKGEIPRYEEPPENLFSAVKRLQDLSERLGSTDLLRAISLNLQSPYDYYFSREVLQLFCTESFETDLNIGIYTASIREFASRYAEEIGPLKDFGHPEVFQPTEKVVPETNSRKRNLKPEDIGGGRTFNLIHRWFQRGPDHFTVNEFLGLNLKDLIFIQNLGRKGLSGIYSFLIENFPEERLTKQLKEYLGY